MRIVDVFKELLIYQIAICDRGLIHLRFAFNTALA